MEYPFEQKVPSFAEASALVKEGMKTYAEQANQVMAVIACVKQAKTENYEGYVTLCTQLDVEPVSEEQWATHDKAPLRTLVAASLAKNLPGHQCSPGEIESMLEATQSSSKGQAVRAISRVLLKALNIPETDIGEWTKMISNAVNILM